MNKQKIKEDIEVNYNRAVACIKKNPVMAVVAAFVGGYILGRICQWFKDLF